MWCASPAPSQAQQVSYSPMTSYRLSQLAELTQGVVRGDPDLTISAVGGLDDVPSGGLTFAEDARRLQDALQIGRASCRERVCT